MTPDNLTNLDITDFTDDVTAEVRAMVGLLQVVDRPARAPGMGPLPQSAPLYGDADDAARVLLRWLDDLLLRGAALAKQLGQRRGFTGATFRVSAQGDTRLVRGTGSLVFPDGTAQRADGVGCLLQRIDTEEYLVITSSDAAWHWYASHAGGEPGSVAQRAAHARAQQRVADGAGRKQWQRRAR